MRSANGGPAFPVPGLQHDEDFNGMSLRDYFAAKALNAVLGSEWSFADYGFQLQSGKSVPEQYASCAYQLADAMLAARGAA